MKPSKLHVPYHPSDPIRGGTDLQERLLNMIAAPDSGPDSERALRYRILDLFNEVFDVRYSWSDLVVTREELFTDLLIKTQDRSRVLVFEIKWKDAELSNQTEDARQNIKIKYPESDCRFVFATLDGSDPEDTAWIKAQWVPFADVAATVLTTETRNMLSSRHTVRKTTRRLKEWLPVRLGSEFPASLVNALSYAASEPIDIVPAYKSGSPVATTNGGWVGDQYLRLCPRRFLQDERFRVEVLADKHQDMPFANLELSLEADNPILCIKSMAKGMVDQKRQYREIIASTRDFLHNPARRSVPAKDSYHYLFHMTSAGPLPEEEDAEVLLRRIIDRSVNFIETVWPVHRAAMDHYVANVGCADGIDRVPRALAGSVRT